MKEPFREKNPSHTHHYYGVYFGKVEQRVDPERRHRVRVRVFGMHSPEIEVSELPWALPNHAAWEEGGFFGVPPLGSTVTILFEAGNHERPVYFGGHWSAPKGILEAPQGKLEPGKGYSVHLERATSAFGGKPGTGLLALEEGVEASNAPNNFGFASPYNKHLELDDRGGRQKVKLSDQADNSLYINTEHGGLTLHCRGGAQQDLEAALVGFGFIANPDSTVRSWQIYSDNGYNITADERRGFLEIQTPGQENPHKVILDAARNRIEIRTSGGHSLILADGFNTDNLNTAAGVLLEDVKKRLEEKTLAFRQVNMAPRGNATANACKMIMATTSGGRQLVLADNIEGNQFALLASKEGGAILINDKPQYDLPKGIAIKANGMLLLEGDGISIKSNGGVTVQGSTVALNEGSAMSALPQGLATPSFDPPTFTPRTVRAQDYPYYIDPEKVPE